MTTREKLVWGASWLVPEDATAAWGARLIVRQDGYVDLVPDRQDAVGIDQAHKDLLLGYLGKADPLKNVAAMLRNGTIQTRKEEELTVYEDSVILVRGNSNASAGYFYICAYLKEG